MSTTLTQIITFAASEAYRADPQGTLAPYIDLLRVATGSVKSYHGLTAQSPAEVFVFNIWDEPTSYDALLNASRSEPIIDAFENAAKDKATTIYAQFRSDPRVAATSPVTELALITMKEGHTRESVASDLDALITLGVPPAGPTWGPVVECDDTLVLVAGWRSAHKEYLQNPPERLPGLAGALLLASSWKVVEAQLVEAA
ncbi:hypothetical protein A0H81_05760 [Grifola frondosa]|uniref:ABM domain-containing protein n=1 Tax=Grifola frondosa TaxID=5627 RepID=A0A1C7MBP0_GRIFR|nr:hypothetical protein A0H81_05760 [Grifola frondosa]